MKISSKIISGAIAGILTIAGMGGIANTQSVSVNASVKQTSTSTKLQKFTKIKVEDAVNDIIIRSGKDYRLTYTGEDKNKPTFYVDNNVLNVTTKSHGIFGWFNFSFFSKITGGTVTIEVPKEKLQALSVDTSNGNVTVSNISLDKGKVSASNGDIALDKIESSNGIKVDTSNGDITVKNSKFSGYKLSTSNGKIDYYGTNISNEFIKSALNSNLLNANTSNGDISIN